MSAANWLVPLNVHHSMKLRSLSSSSNANSQHLQNISSSLSALTYQINTIEKNSIELTGTANSILQLLESNKYKQSTIGAMRLLLFNHAKTCKEAINEDDNVLAYSICLISERMINQPWFNFDLFSLVSFDEMEKAEKIKGTCQNIMKEIQDNMSLEEWNMIKVFQESINAIESARKKSNRLAVVQYWRAGKLETHENYMSAYDNLRNIERSIIEPANALFDGRIRIEVEDITQ